jgi:hypothetical protein
MLARTRVVNGRRVRTRMRGWRPEIARTDGSGLERPRRGSTPAPGNP